jgi:hypothetical protein
MEAQNGFNHLKTGQIFRFFNGLQQDGGLRIISHLKTGQNCPDGSYSLSKTTPEIRPYHENRPLDFRTHFL